MASRATIIAAVIAAAVAIAAAYYWMSGGASGPPLIGITQIVSHPALDAVREGTVEGLESRGYVDGDNIQIEFRNANGDPSLTLPIAQDFVRKGASVIVPITTPSALGAAKSTEDVPIVFGGVSDPVGVGLVSALDRPGGNITGTSDRWPFEQQIATYLEVLPDIGTVGMLYRPGDDVSRIAVDALRALEGELGYELVVQPVSNAGDVYRAAVSIFKEVEVVYTGLDNLVVENLESVLKAAIEAKKPVIGGDSGSVERGALMALSVNMRDLGVQTGNLVADVLEGGNPGEIPVSVVEQADLVVSARGARQLDLDLEALAARGATILE